MHDELHDDHHRIRALLADLAGSVRPGHGPDATGFANARWMLVRELTRHYAAETSVFGTALVPKLGVERYRAHMAAWTADAIAAHWREFGEELLSILRQIERDMLREEREMYGRPERTGPAQ